MYLVESSDGYDWYPEDVCESREEAVTLTSALNQFHPYYEGVEFRIRLVTAEELARSETMPINPAFTRV